jgi:SAM-dependent methyltransferase
MTYSRCLTCALDRVDRIVDLGLHPPSNRYVSGGIDDADRHRLMLGQCTACGQVQLIDAMPASMVRPRYAWLTYVEPERHLDLVATRIAALPNVHVGSKVVGLTYKDGTLLHRLNRLGFVATDTIDVARDLFVADPGAGLEAVQAAMSPAASERIVQRLGASDVVIVRHVLEHAHDPMAFMSALRAIVAADGYVVIEVPDCTKFISARDFVFIWEEHITYFDSETLAQIAARADFDVVAIDRHSFALEDSLVAVLQKRSSPHAGRRVSPSCRTESAKCFGADFDATYCSVRERVDQIRRHGKRVGMLGAGHHGARFINVFDLGDRIDCVIDDSPRKQGLLMPGSRVPIVGSSGLESIDCCLLSLSPESEASVVSRNRAFIDRGGTFASIFRMSPISFLPT